MKFSELIGKEIVNICDGTRFGTVGNSDLVIELPDGKIDSIILPNKNELFSFIGKKQSIVIPWNSIIKIGSEVIIVEIDDFRSINAKKRY